MTQRKNSSPTLSWQMAAVIISGGVCFMCIAIFASPETHTLLFGANGLLWTVVSYFLRSPLPPKENPYDE